MTEEEQSGKLPNGWVWTSLGVVADYTNGRAFKSSEWEDTGRPILRIQNLTRSTNETHHYSKPIEEKYLVKDGDLLISWSATLGAFIHRGREAVLNQHIFKVTPHIDNMFLFYLVSAYIQQLKDVVHGSGMQHITKDRFQNSPIPLPPLFEQRRVVSKIEELFSFLDAGVESLRKVKAQLKRYRQAVLKYAFEGKLTEEWRKTHRDQIEPATKLLERLREVRKDTKFKKLQRIDTSDLLTLSEEWTWASIGEIAESMRNGVYKPRNFYGNNGVACLRMYNIENGAIVWKDVKRMNLTPEEIEFYELKPGDILVNRVNSRELVGKAAAIPSGLERCVYESKNIRLRLPQDYANSKYVNFWFLMYSQKFFSRNAQQTVGMASINQEQLASMPIPFCHLNEQTKVIEEIERLFSIADDVEKIATDSIKHADKLRQSILKMTFEGKLVPQDPGDEPAERLLERIREEKAKSKGEKNSKRIGKDQPKQLELSTYVK